MKHLRASWAVVVLALWSAPVFAQEAVDVVDAGADVVPPQLLQPSPAAYPEDAGTGGDVELLLTIDTQGAVIDVTVQSSVGEVFTEAALLAAKGLTFEPATQNGAPISVVLAYRYRFEAPVLISADAGEVSPFGKLSGQVLTRGTRESIALAQIGLEDGGITTVETDSDGRFTIELPPGPQRVLVTASGHVKRVFKENLKAGQSVQVLYRLNRTFSKPYETVVRGQVDRAELSRISLSGAELHEVAGTNGEPLRVIMLLPGVVTPASGLSYPVVRGALPAATGFFLDGVRVPQLYHLLAGGSVVHPDFIESIDFYPANAPTRYGRISGGVIAAQVAKARDDRVHFTVSPDLLQTSAFVEVPIEKTGTNITVGGHINYAAWLLAVLSQTGAFGEGVTPVFESWDYQARIEQKLGKGTVRLLAFGSSDLVGTRTTDPKSPSVFLTSRFHRIDLRLQQPVGPGHLEVGSFIGWETLGLYGEQNNERVGSFLLNRFIVTGRTSYRVELGEHFQLKAGFDVERQVSDVETTIGIGAGGDLLRQPRVMGVFTGTFLEAAFFSEQWTVVAGVRLDTWHLAPSFTMASVDPRLEVRFKPFEAVTFRGTAGLAHQSPMLLISLPVTDVGALRTGLQEVGQFSVGAVGKLPWFGMELSADVFLNHIFQARERSLSEFVTGISSLDDRFSGNRFGRAYGLELMLRLPQQGRLFGWLSYSLMRSERLRRFAIYNEDQSEVTDATAMVPFAFDQAHSLNLVLGYQLPKGFKVSAAFHLNTGRPESGEFSSRTQRLVDDSATGRQLWSLMPLNQVDRLPAFGRLDVRASKAIAFNTFNIEIYLDVFNVLVRPEVYGYTYGYGTEADPNVPTKTALSAPIILPTLGVKVVY
ncbi:MAG: TonB family protein [Archangium sp.]|nr:TonB family protein [Archangium sp.]MDP3153364.1 TonB family protein [Archangium sp.]MDP3573478.1 TonB family protein [Archangium sp.]